MKVILGIVAMLFVGVVYGETSFTYEKIGDNVVQIVEVESHTISTTNITIPNLRVRIEKLEDEKTEAIARIDKQIAFIQAQIGKAKELGVKE